MVFAEYLFFSYKSEKAMPEPTQLPLLSRIISVCSRTGRKTHGN